MKDKIYFALKSSFRYLQLNEMNAPSILIDNEKRLLTKRFNDLTPQEAIEADFSWKLFYEEQIVIDAVQDEQLTADLDMYMKSLN